MRTNKSFNDCRNSIAFEKLQEELDEKKQMIQQTTAEVEKWSEATKQIEALTGKVTDVKQIDGLKMDHA